MPILASVRKRLPTWRTLLVALVHALAFAFAYAMSYALRLTLPIPQAYAELFWRSLPVVIAVKLAIFLALGHARFSWRHPTFSALSALLRAATLATLVLATLDLAVRQHDVPRSIWAIDWAMTVLTLGGLRALWRLSREELRLLVNHRGCRRALIVGANPSGEFLARQFLDGRRHAYLAVGFVDDDPRLHGSRLVGTRVLGATDEAIRFARQLGAQDVLVIAGVLSGQRLRDLVERCKAENLELKVIPAIDGFLSGDYAAQIRDVDINDLLRREPVELSSDAIREQLTGRTIMVTGAGGSIGAEICRQVLHFHPRRLLLVERAENSLFLVEREFAGRGSATEIRPLLADINDRARLEQILADERPEIVFHAAAHKHVPMMEHNPGEAIKNNVLATAQLAELADDYGVQQFVLISTDKSVNPASVMGASKQLAERFVNAFSEAATTRFVVVRFGNVLASAGSVVPIFQEQIRAGGPITITHPDMERFFMTIPEASQLVLQAAAMGGGGEIFVLDMGRPVRIVDLAHDLIRLSRLSPDDIPIQYVGLRPGEKLKEELYFKDEQMLPTQHPKLFAAYHRSYELDEVRRMIAELAELVNGPEGPLRAKLAALIPEYQPHAPSANGSLAGAGLSTVAPTLPPGS